MKKILLTATLVLCIFVIYAQKDKSDTIILRKGSTIQFDSAVRGIINLNARKYLDENLFRKRVARDFGRIVSGSPTETALSNVATVDVADGVLKASYASSISKNGKWFLAAAIGAKSDNNLFAVFDNTRFAPEASLKVSVHFRPSRATTYFYLPSQRKTLVSKLLMANAEWAAKGKKLAHEMEIYRQRIAYNKSRLHAVKAANADGVEGKKNELEIAELQQVLDSLIAYQPAAEARNSQQLAALADSKQAALEKIQMDAPYNGYRIFWFTATVSGSGKEYTIFDTLATPRRLETDYNYISSGYSFGFKLNFLRWRRQTVNTFFATLGIENYNKEEFTGVQKDIQVRSTVTDASGNPSVLTSSHKAYDRHTLTRKYFTDVSFDAIWYPTKKNFFAVNSLLLLQTTKGAYSDIYIVPGVVINASKKVKEGEKKQLVSLNIYWRFKLRNGDDEAYKLREQSQFGIRVNLPFNPVTFFTEE